MRPRDRGFTLIELMVVVLVIGVLLAVAVPTFLGARTRGQDTAAQANLRTVATAALAAAATDGLASLTAAQIATIEPSLGAVPGSTASTATGTVSVEASAASWSAAVRSASGRCFYVTATAANPSPRWGSSATAPCTGQVARLAMGATPGVALGGGSGLVGWYDPSLASSVTTEAGNRVVRLADLSGSGAHVTATSGAASRPTVGTGINGLASVGNAAGQGLAGTTTALAASRATIFAVYATTVVATHAVVMLGPRVPGQGVGIAWNSAAVHGGPGYQAYTWALSAANAFVTSSAPSTQVQVGVFDGVSQSSVVNGGAPVTQVVASVPAQATAPISLGWDGGGQSLQGQLGEVLVFDRVLSALERQQVERYLGAKWGITVA